MKRLVISMFLFMFVFTFLVYGEKANVESPYGVCAHITRGSPTKETCLAMRLANIGWVRTDFDWSRAEVKKGVWDWSHFDAIVEECERQGIQLLPILGKKLPDWGQTPWTNLEDWSGYVEQVVRHYGRRLPVLEVLNEPNVAKFGDGTLNPTNYFALLKCAYETVKRIDPTIQVALGGTSHVPYWYIEEIYKLGGAKYFDIMNVHPYTTDFYSEPEGSLDVQITKLRELMSKYGDGNKRIWITELGWPTPKAKLEESALMRVGLEKLNPDKKDWRILYAPVRMDDTNEEICQMLRDGLPHGATLEICLNEQLGEKLNAETYDAVICPLGEEYLPESVSALYEYVKKGGVMIDFGGMSMFTALKKNESGELVQIPRHGTWHDRRKFRVCGKAFWFKDEKPYPGILELKCAPWIKDEMVLREKYELRRFFEPEYLEKGDEFIPLLEAETNGYCYVGAVIQKFNSDMKGAVILCGLKGLRYKTNNDDRQAVMTARALGLAFAEGIEKFFVYELRQAEFGEYDRELHFGIMRGNYVPKPAYLAYMTFIHTRPMGSVHLAKDWRNDALKLYYPQWKMPNGNIGGMVWSTKINEVRCMEFSTSRMIFRDVNGVRLFPKRSGNTYELIISDSPIFFTGGSIVSGCDK